MPILTGVSITFDTHHDNKDFDTVLHVFVKNRLNTTHGTDHYTDFVTDLLAYQRYLDTGDLSDHSGGPYLAYGIGLAADQEFDDDPSSSHTIDLTLMPDPVSLDDIVLPAVSIHVQPNGDDRWIFDYTVNFSFDDGSGFSFSSRDDGGLHGVLIDHNNRNYAGLCAENPLRPLPVPDRPVTSAVLKKVSLDFFTHLDDRDDDTRLDIRIVNRLNAATRQDIAVGENLFPGQTIHDNDEIRTVTWSSQDGDLPLTEVGLADLVLPEVDITIDPNGNDRWVFDYRLTLEFADPGDFGGKRTVYSSRTGGVMLDQDVNRHVGVYHGPSFPSVAARTAPPLTDLPVDQVGRRKLIPVALLQRKVEEFINGRNGADDSPNPPLRKLRLDNSGVYNDETLPESYADLLSIEASQGAVRYVSSPISFGQLTKYAGLADLYLRDINSAVLTIDVDPAAPAPLVLSVVFETGGSHETTGGTFTTMDFLEFSFSIKLTLDPGVIVDEFGNPHPGVDALHWITELEDLQKSRVLDHFQQPGNIPFYRYQGTLLSQPVDVVVPNDSAQDLFIDDLLTVHLVTSSALDPGGFFRQDFRDKLFSQITDRDKFTGRSLRDSLNSTATSWLLGGVADEARDDDGNNTELTDIRFDGDNLVITYNGPRKAFRPAVPADWPTSTHQSQTWDFSPGTLANIDHIVVLMMENRSFDHMLGYLSLPVDQGGAGRTDVDGLTGTEVNPYRGVNYPVFPLTETVFSPDPPHGFEPVHRTLDNGLMDGFVKALAEQSGSAIGGRIMGHHTATTVPVYDELARDFAVGHRWFSSHPGPTFCNRFYELTGHLNVDTRGFWEFDNTSPPRPVFTDTIFDHLSRSVDPATGRAPTWAYFEQGYCFLRLFEQHTFDDENIADVDDPERGFFARAAAGTLPDVTFVEPRFIELPPGSNCDGPPGDVALGQAFVEKVVEAVVASPNWDRTLMLLIYDEHGGFYDHVPASTAERVSPELPIDLHGARVPAFVISPWVAGGTVFGDDNPRPGSLRNDLHFDHTSVLKTIARRFMSADPPYLGARYAAANDLSSVVSATRQSGPFRPFIKYHLQFRASQLALGPKDGTAVPGAPLWQLAADGSAAQDFSFENAGGGSFYLRNRAGNLYLTAQPAPPPTIPPKSVPLGVTLEVKHQPGSLGLRQRWIAVPVLDRANPGDLYLIESLSAVGKVLQPASRNQAGAVVLDRNGSVPNTGLLNAWKIDSPQLPG
jgi:phospholipase C